MNSWRKIAPHAYNIAKATAAGSAITLGSTVFSCYLALEIEKAAHRAQFKFFPEWYANVEHANGIDPDQLANVRAAAREKQMTQQLAIQKQAEEKQIEESVEESFSTKTIFSMERFVAPVKNEVERRAKENPLGLDLGGCAMTA